MLWGASAQAAVIFEKSIVAISASGAVYSSGHHSHGTSDYDIQQTTVLSNLAATANLPPDPLVLGGELYGTTFGNFGGTATFFSPYAGEFNLMENAHLAIYKPNTLAQIIFASSFYYSFVTDHTSNIHMSYSEGHDIEIFDTPTEDIILYRLGFPAGDLSFILPPGRYTLSYGTEGVHDGALIDTIGAVDKVLTKKFSFEISSVPEPSEWALVIAGLALTGVALRMRRRALQFLADC